MEKPLDTKKINKQTGRTYGEEGNFSSQHSLGGSFPSNAPPPFATKKLLLIYPWLSWATCLHVMAIGQARKKFVFLFQLEYFGACAKKSSSCRGLK